MKKLLIVASLAVAGSVSAFGQVSVLVAGWDFEFAPAANYSALSPAGVLGANYSDLYAGANGTNNPVNDGAASALRGTMYLNGTNGSDLWTFTGPTAAATKQIDPFTDADQQILTRDGSATKFGGFGGLDTAALGLNRTTGTRSEISFVLNTTGLASLDEVTYRTRMQTELTTSIDWSLVVGANTFNLGGPLNVSGTVFSSQAFDLSTIDLAGATSVTLIGTIANAATNNVLLLDNLGVYGVTAIPEPGTYAAALGFLTLVIVGLRRRFSAAKSVA